MLFMAHPIAPISTSMGVFGAFAALPTGTETTSLVTDLLACCASVAAQLLQAELVGGNKRRREQPLHGCLRGCRLAGQRQFVIGALIGPERLLTLPCRFERRTQLHEHGFRNTAIWSRGT